LSPAKPVRHGVARVISKLGLGSRTQAAQWVREGRVRVNGQIVRDAEYPVVPSRDRVTVDGEQTAKAKRVVLMLNKPRGLVTSASDEQGRATVYDCLVDANMPWLAPVGRLDKASEGLLLFTNDPEWAARITAPKSGPEKTYHVQVDCVPSADLISKLERGVSIDGERLTARSVRTLRTGQKNGWLEITLDEGRNRQIRRLLAELDIGVLRLIRVAIGPLPLGGLKKGKWRLLDEKEIESL
jgi:23S rRNA pseudouridine2605 synthase